MKKTVVISCAGKGSRLGRYTPKCLLEVRGKTIIQRLLESLGEVDEIIVVTGYKENLVKEYIQTISKTVKFVNNHDYENTSAGKSIILGVNEARNDMIIAIVGDLIIDPIDIKKILKFEEQFACGGVVTTESPIFIKTENDYIIDINRENGDLEWSGLAGLYKKNIKSDAVNLYNIVESILPVKAIKINAREIDTPNDLIEAERWLQNNYDNNIEKM